MKNILKYLLIIAFASISFGAVAQLTPIKTTVMKGAVRKYVIEKSTAEGNINAGNTLFFWEIKTKAGAKAVKGTDYNAYTVYTIPGAASNVTVDLEDNSGNAVGIANNTIYIEWLAINATTDQTDIDYVATVTEKDKSSFCYDSSINTNTLHVIILENNFEIKSVLFSRANTTELGKKGLECAIAADKGNAVSFIITREGGKPKADWSFKYQYRLNDSDPWIDGTEQTISGNGTDDNNIATVTIDDAAGLHTADLIGTGVYKVEFRVVDALDYYKTQAKNFATPSDELTKQTKGHVDINKIPAGQTIQLD